MKLKNKSYKNTKKGYIMIKQFKIISNTIKLKKKKSHTQKAPQMDLQKVPDYQNIQHDFIY